MSPPMDLDVFYNKSGWTSFLTVTKKNCYFGYHLKLKQTHIKHAEKGLQCTPFIQAHNKPRKPTTNA